MPAGTWLVRQAGVLCAITPTAPRQLTVQPRLGDDPTPLVVTELARVRDG